MEKRFTIRLWDETESDIAPVPITKFNVLYTDETDGFEETDICKAKGVDWVVTPTDLASDNMDDVIAPLLWDSIYQYLLG